MNADMNEHTDRMMKNTANFNSCWKLFWKSNKRIQKVTGTDSQNEVLMADALRIALQDYILDENNYVLWF